MTDAFICDYIRTPFGRRRALATMCIGVGQGIAIALKRV